MDTVEKLRDYENFNYADQVNIRLTAADHIEQVREALKDAETLIESLRAQQSKPQPQTVKDALEQAASLSDELNPPEYYTQVERDAYSLGVVYYWQAIRALIQK